MRCCGAMTLCTGEKTQSPFRLTYGPATEMIYTLRVEVIDLFLTTASYPKSISGWQD